MPSCTTPSRSRWPARPRRSPTITQRLVATGREAHEKRDTLRELIRGAADLKNAIVFCNRKRDVAVLHRSLQKHGFNAAALHGDMDQRARMAALEGFRAGETTVLVASDVAARGLDIPAVSHIFNYDVPHHAEDYVHRIGRTGRAGRSGYAFTLVARGDEKSLAAIERLIQQPIAVGGTHHRRTSAVLGSSALLPRDRDGPRTRVRAPPGRREGEGREPARRRKPRLPRRNEQRERPARESRRVAPERPSPARPERQGRPARDRQTENRRIGTMAAPMSWDSGDHIPAFLLPPGRASTRNNLRAAV